MSDEDRNGTARVLAVLEALCGYAANGASNSDLAKAIKATPPQITRAMAPLLACGWARKAEDTGRFFPTAQFTRLTFRVLEDFQRLEDRISNTRRSMTGT